MFTGLGRIVAALTTPRGGPIALVQLDAAFVAADDNDKTVFPMSSATICTTDTRFQYELRITSAEDPDDEIVVPVHSGLNLARTDSQMQVRLEFDLMNQKRRALLFATTRGKKDVDGFVQMLCTGMFEQEHQSEATPAMIDQVMSYCRTDHMEDNPLGQSIQLLEFDQSEARRFVPVTNEAGVGFETVDDGGFEHTLNVFDANGNKTYSELVTKLHSIEPIEASSAVVWLANTGGKMRIFQLRFGVAEQFGEFWKQLGVKLYEAKKGEDAQKLKDDMEWVTGAFEPMQINADDDDDDDEARRLQFDGEDAQNEVTDDDSEDEDDGFRVSSPVGPGDKVGGLELGMTNNRAFIQRGNFIDVRAVTHDGVGDMVTTPIKVATPYKSRPGEMFTPTKVMLHESESSLLMLDPNHSSSVFKMDLNRGEITEEWKASKHDVDILTRDLQHSNKLAQRTGEKTFMGVNDNQFFRMDPRLGSDNKLTGVEEDFKSYNKNTTKFSCGATTGGGHLVMGSTSGEVRMFNTDKKINMNAKTTLPGLGDPLIGLDVSEDGAYILGTTKTYLIVIPTELEEGGNGFTKRMGKNKPTPLKLQMNFEDIVKYQITKVHFKPARFSIDENTGETRIVTSTGPFVLTWDFAKIKKKKLDTYKIRKLDETVVDGHFMFNNDKSLVIAKKTGLRKLNLK